MTDKHFANGEDTPHREAYGTVVVTKDVVILTSRVRLVLPIATPLGKMLEVAAIASDDARSALYASIDDYICSESGYK